MPNQDPFVPSAQLLIQLGSIIIHYEEMTSAGGHHDDKAAIDSLRKLPEVQEWFKAMDEMSFLPKKRSLNEQTSDGTTRN